MKATLEFDLNDFDDRMAHLRCVKSTDMALALWEIRCNLRKKCEHILENTDFAKPDSESESESVEFRVLEIILNEIGEIIEDNNLNPDEYIH